ncbi:MAG: sulfite oxidase [Acidobacteria bacterium]|nr:sulfite oxidase [Acidobacteriota bacterium]MCI0722039.1 sulfite oxidase [Acidobacteriota bacterium]
MNQFCNGQNAKLIDRRAFCTSLAMLSVWHQPALRASRIPSSVHPQIEEFDFAALRGPETPRGEFFVRNHFAVPSLNQRNWRLKVTGCVKIPLELDFAGLVREGSKTISVTLECAGNAVGGGAVSTARWTGVPLERLLKRAGLCSGVKCVRLVGADRGVEDLGRAPVFYMRSLPVEKALHPDTLLAYQMNGDQLPVEHGFPLRAVVPGWYAMDSVKWLVHIQALDHEDKNIFMTERYISTQWRSLGSERQPINKMRVKSQIARPHEGELIERGPYIIRGAAWAGENRVTQVQVSVDEGKEWRPAELEEEGRAYKWVLWKYPWSTQRPGSHAVMVRAFDDRGNEQPLSRDSHRLDGYELNWVHSVRCRVKQSP